MSLKNNIDEQRKYLEENLDQINAVVSEFLGITINLRVEEKTDYRNQTYFKLVDDKNIRDCCGVMAKAYRYVSISDFGIWWRDDGVCFHLSFHYTLVEGGSNGADFCTVDIVDNVVKIKEKSNI